MGLFMGLQWTRHLRASRVVSLLQDQAHSPPPAKEEFVWIPECFVQLSFKCPKQCSEVSNTSLGRPLHSQIPHILLNFPSDSFKVGFLLFGLGLIPSFSYPLGSPILLPMIVLLPSPTERCLLQPSHHHHLDTFRSFSLSLQVILSLIFFALLWFPSNLAASANEEVWCITVGTFLYFK